VTLPRRLTLDLEIERAREIVRGFDASLEPVGIARLHGGSTEVYRIDLAVRADPLVLKVYGHEPAWAAAKEALVAGWIADVLDAAVPRWLQVDERRVILPLSFALMTWLPGETVRDLMSAPDIDAVYWQMGALLRSVHRISMNGYGDIRAGGVVKPETTNDAYMRSAFEVAFRQFRDHSGEANLAKRLEDQASSRFGLLACSNGPVLCHGDFQQGNLLATRDAVNGLHVTGLIDFGNARAADAVFDLAKTLFSSTHEDPRSRQAILSGYGQIDHPDLAGAIWLYTLYHRMSMWNWLTRLGDDRASDGSRRLLRDLDQMSR
jgi:aminoglycoside phosphotransferase (APT) family kinase protein